MTTRIRNIGTFVVLSLLMGAQLWACSEYVHLWRPVSEERSELCSAEGLAFFIEQLVADKLAGQEKIWRIGLNPDAAVTASFSFELQRAVGLLDQSCFKWTGDDSMFSSDQSADATIWLDFVKPERLVYIWRDENRPPFAMFRTGELDTARIRVLAMSSERKVLLIDELPHMFLLESDFMLPSWTANGGAWFRRLSLKTARMPQRYEWTLALPADMEDVNQTPADIRRFYYGATADDNTRIISNY